MPLFTNDGQLHERQNDLPFDDLIDLLEREGFHIGVRDYVEFAAVFRDFRNKKPSQFKYYLAPIVCKNPAEQQTFYRVFDQWCASGKKTSPIKSIAVIFWYWLKSNRYYVLSGIGIIVVLFLFYNSRNNQPTPPSPFQKRDSSPQSPDSSHLQITIRGKAESSAVYRVGDTIEFTAQNSLATRPQSGDTTYTWNFNNSGGQTGRKISHVFETAGNFSVSVKAASRKNYIIADTILNICPASLHLNINPEHPDSNKFISIEIASKNIPPVGGTVHWQIESPRSHSFTTIPYTGKTLTYKPLYSGTYFITLIDSGKNSCELATSAFTITAKPHAVNNYNLTVIPGGGKIPRQYAVNKINIVLQTFLILLLVTIALRWLRILYFRRYPIKRKLGQATLVPDENSERSMEEITGIEEPYDIPFDKRDNSIQTENKLFSVFNELQRKKDSVFQSLDINKTIRNAVISHGLVVPIYVNTKKSYEYVFLVDQSGAFNQHVYLFNYLISKLISKNVIIHYYVFDNINAFKPVPIVKTADPNTSYTEPYAFKNLKKAKEVTLADINLLHPDSELIVVSNGYAFMDVALPRLDTQIEQDLNLWEKRFLITPVLQKNWKANEKILSRSFTLLTADLEGWLQIVMLIEQPDSGFHSKQAARRLPTPNVDFDDIDALEKYFSDADLFQWMCALAVHYRIRWELIIGIGKAILQNAGALHKLNYTNLLRIARIKWIHGGTIPTDLRADMLSKLTTANEILARQTVLGMMEESDPFVKENSLSYQEKQTQILTDKFVLYVNDPGTNSGYKADADRFMELWNSGQILDVALKIHLENEDGKQNPPLKAIEGNKLQPEGQTEIIVKPKRLPLLWVSAAFIILLISISWGMITKYTRSPQGGFETAVNDIFLPALSYYEPKFTDITFDFAEGKCLNTLISRKNNSPLKLELQTSNNIYTQQLHFIASKSDSANSAPDTTHKIVFKNIPVNEIDGSSIALFSSGKNTELMHAGIQSVDKQYGLVITGPLCNLSNQVVYIQYDSTVNKAAAESIRQCILSDGYIAEGIDLLSYKGRNVVKYLVPEMKDNAEILVSELSQCSTEKFVALYAPQPNRRDKSSYNPRQLEIWISSTGNCQTVDFSSIQGLAAGNTYYNDAMTNHLALYPDSIAFNTKNLGSTARISRQIKYCGGSYTIYLLNNNRKVVDSTRLSIDSKGLNILQSKIFATGRYALLFDTKGYTSPDKLTDKRLFGLWQIGNGNDFVLTDSVKAPPQIAGYPSARILKIYYDRLNQTDVVYCSVATVKTSYAMLVIRVTSNSKFAVAVKIAAKDASAPPKNSNLVNLPAFKHISELIKSLTANRQTIFKPVDTAQITPAIIKEITGIQNSIKPDTTSTIKGYELYAKPEVLYCKKGYYAQFRGLLRVGINDLDNSAKTVDVRITELPGQNVISTSQLLSISKPVVINSGDYQYHITLTRIGAAGVNPLTKAAFIYVEIYKRQQAKG
ncbi:PKD domain-containing protein [Mucilaginibacter celer]|uniref:PKD domain-containing protein n=1 Tax=Mucilaginibacter celer TaxID=2305508 RepID=A0A494W730_9SPHI|nr:PKD domain-containing protein [Mucilaginibacter celer]AYL99112.1 PKD domain-containing protein [Mucilaginibacter celer]